MKTVVLSKRMQATVNMVSKGNRVCDVGCDHGYVSIYLVQNHISPTCLAMDVNEGPLERAKEHVKEYGLEKYITTRLSNGLMEYQPSEADTLVIAGMGGRLMQSILEKEPEKTADFKELILQPQSELPLFRKFLRNQGYLIDSEDMVLEDGKFYTIIKAVKEAEKMKRRCEKSEAFNESEVSTELQDYLGPCLIREKHPVLCQFVEKEIEIKEELLAMLDTQKDSEKNATRKEELKGELSLLKECKGQYLL